MRLTYIISIFICIFISCSAFTQTYNYSYTDPCTGNLKTIVVPINGNVSVGYYGEIGSFSYDDFTNGTFEQWANNIFAQYGQDSPCATIVGIGTAVTVTQNTTFNVVGILNSLSTIADAAASGASNILGGSVSSIGNSGGSDSKEDNNQNKGTNGSNSNNGSSGSNASGSSTVSGSGNNGTSSQEGSGTTESGSTSESGSTETSSTETGSSESPSGSEGTSTEGSNTEQSGTGGEVSSSSQSGSGGNGSGGETTQETPQQESGQGQTEGKSNITGTATTTTKNAPSKSEGGKPSVVASSDFVGFNFRNSEVRTGAKATGGYTAMRWDGKRSYGALADYTTALKGPNITGFYAWIGPKAITLLSGTCTIGFDGNKSLYGTIAAGQMFRLSRLSLCIWERYHMDRYSENRF